MQVELNLGVYAVVFISYIVITSLVLFLCLFRKGRLVRNNFVFALVQTYTLLHTVLKFTANESMVRMVVGRSFAVILALASFACIYLNMKKHPWANKISAILAALSLVNLWYL